LRRAVHKGFQYRVASNEVLQQGRWQYRVHKKPLASLECFVMGGLGSGLFKKPKA
jgi:hypothetical protein